VSALVSCRPYLYQPRSRLIHIVTAVASVCNNQRSEKNLDLPARRKHPTNAPKENPAGLSKKAQSLTTSIAITVKIAKEKVFFHLVFLILLWYWLGGESRVFILKPVGFEPRTARYSRSPRLQLNGVSSIPLSHAG